MNSNNTRSVQAANMIFTTGEVLPQFTENPRTRLDVLRQIHEDEETFAMFQRLRPNEQEAFLQFCIGNRNTFGPFHAAEAEVFVCPTLFEESNIPPTPEGDPKYKLRRFYTA